MSDEERSEEKEVESTESVEAAGKEAEEKAKSEGLSEDEVNKRVEAARKQEKDKLYDRIAGLESTLKDLRDAAKADRDAKEKAEQEAKEKADAERKAELSADERLAEQMKHIEERLAKEAAERERLEQELKDERERQELELYRQQLLQTAGDDIIPDLVRGNTRTDIDRSVAFAKSRYQELFQVTKKKAEGNVPGNMPGPTNPDPSALDEAELQKSVANFNVDIDRYNKDRTYRAEIDSKRKEVTDQVGSAYERSLRG